MGSSLLYLLSCTNPTLKVTLVDWGTKLKPALWILLQGGNSSREVLLKVWCLNFENRTFRLLLPSLHCDSVVWDYGCDWSAYRSLILELARCSLSFSLPVKPSSDSSMKTRQRRALLERWALPIRRCFLPSGLCMTGFSGDCIGKGLSSDSSSFTETKSFFIRLIGSGLLIDRSSS